jgi:radical SAM protein with 4Fe4S-binding SPASM domain
VSPSESASTDDATARRLALLAPRYAEIRPTNACQLDCVGCWYYSPHVERRPVEWQRRQLSPAVFATVLDDLEAAGFRQLHVSGGGDPLAHPQIYDLLESAAARFEVLVITNVLLCKDPDRLARSRIKAVFANFNAGDARTYVAYHPNQREESYERLLVVLRRLARDVAVTLSCVLGRVNCHDVENMLRACKETTGRIHFKTLRTVEPAMMTAAQRADLAARLPAYADLADRLGVVHNLRTYVIDSDHPPIESASCFAGHFTSVIHADGSVTVCCQAEQDTRLSAIGNVNETRFRDLWRSPAYDARREALEARRYDPWCRGCVYFATNKRLTEEMAKT